MRVEFKQTWRFSDNGHSFIEYPAGWSGEVSESCGASALQEGVAVSVGDKEAAAARQKAKAVPGPERNAALFSAPENK